MLLLSALTLMATASGPQLHVIELDPKRPRSVHEIRAAPGVSTTLNFPEAWAAPPVCGDCAFGDDEVKGQLWRLEVVEATNTIVVKPTRLPGPDVPPAAFLTNIDVTLKSGVAVTMFVKLVLPEEAFARVEFRLPESAMAASVLDAERQKLQAEFAARVDVALQEELLEAFLGKVRCRDTWGGPRQDKRMVVRVFQICRNRSFIFVNFEVENAAREDLQLLGASLTDADDASSDRAKFSRKLVKFDERVPGVVLLPLEDETIASSSYELVVTEDGGQARTVTITGLTF